MPNPSTPITLCACSDVPVFPQPSSRETTAHCWADGSDLIVQALDHLTRSIQTDGSSHGAPTLARQKEDLREWARSLGLLLKHANLLAQVVRGGQEHDLFHDTVADRYFKVTRDGVFGFSPGIDLALVASGEDGRRFHLWEATPIEYLDRLLLQNRLVPGLNALEGVLDQEGDLAIVTSQPRFEIVPVTQAEIDGWFQVQRFEKITACGYYRAEDNLGVFDAHAKNLVRFEDTLIPFDVIPCRPGYTCGRANAERRAHRLDFQADVVSLNRQDFFFC